MKTESRYITRGIQAELPSWLVNLLWFMRDGMEVEKQDYLQIFRLSRTDKGQRIEHEQEQPPYQKTLDVPCEDAVGAKVYIIDDGTHVTMLLADEY
ncbi:MAG: DUF960 domain-containing protein [Oscillospiraceae bacterium]|nr:DUF960 domain-containing protein [Oscillospiraceae bacterium]